MLCCIFYVRFTAIQSTKRKNKQTHSHKTGSLWNSLESALISPHQNIFHSWHLVVHYVNSHLLVHELALSNSTGTLHNSHRNKLVRT